MQIVSGHAEDIKTQTERLNDRITFSIFKMEFLSAITILVFAMYSSGYAQFDTGFTELTEPTGLTELTELEPELEPPFQGEELSSRKVNPVDVVNAATNVAGTTVDATGKIIDLLANTYGRGAGRIPDKTPCPAGLRDDGTSCWSDAHIYGKGCCCTAFGCCKNCHSGYHDDGCTCRKTDVGIKVTLMQRQTCRDNEDKYGALCYPKCREGYVAAGCCVCKRIKKI